LQEDRPAKKDKKKKETMLPKPAAKKRRKEKDNEDGSKKKKRRKKDPNAPKRALSAFMRFQLAERKVHLWTYSPTLRLLR
jgi:structure-specific recognition protein 1